MRPLTSTRLTTLLAFTATLGGCLLLPPEIREQAREAQPPAANHFRPAPANALPGLAESLVAEPAVATGKPGAWPPARGGLLKRAAPAAPDAAWPPPFVPRHGQLLASEQGSAQGLFLSLFSAEPHPFVHTALVAVEDGGTFVYETNGTLRAELGGAPADRVAGGVRRVAWDDFAREQRYIAVFDPPAGLDVERAVAFARAQLGNPFDARFDASDASALYCTELTARSLAAGGVPPALAPFTANASLRSILAWLGIRGDALYTPATVTAGLEPVALVSRWHSRRQIHAYFAAKAELQQRFTADQKIGNVIAYSPFTGLRLRPAVQGFLAAVNDAAPNWPEADARQADDLATRIGQLARMYLGAGPAGAMAGQR